LRNEIYAAIAAAMAKSKVLDESGSELTDRLNEIWTQLERLHEE
jgi:hypothetical protein